MPETVRRLLPGKAGRTRCRQHVLERFQLNGFAAFAQRRFKLGLDVEMVFNDPLVPAGDKTKCSIPASIASSTTYCTTGLSTTVSISLGTALVAGRKRVPNPATGRTAFLILRVIVMSFPHSS
jgi:hypothetical protein